ncbi:MAG TPA: zinc-ribbon and DUF3426 domain-containing protein [Steroidobacteraceae bacterium]
MFTVCPKCALTLVVTAEDLRVAQGYVRCGRCSSVFNALARLSEEQQTPEGSVGAAAAAPAPSPSIEHTPLENSVPASSASTQAPEMHAPSKSVTDEDAIPEEALEFDAAKTDISSVFVEPPPNPQWTAATGTFKAMIAANQEAAQVQEEAVPKEAVPKEAAHAQDSDSQVDVEIDPALLASILNVEPLVPPAPTPAPPPASPPVRPPRHEATAVSGAAPAATSAPAPRPAPVPTGSAPEAAASALSAALEARTVRKTRPDQEEETAWTARLLPYAWRAGAGLALLVLLAQIVNHYRDDLAASARFNRPLTALYASFGMPLLPRWDLRAYDVRQLGASVEQAGSGLITVRASIKNAAPQPQPLPLLRVTLQDRFGNRIAARDVAPRFYLPGAKAASAFLSAGERIDADMGFVDPGANAVGFEIDACLPTSGGEVICANDAAAR